MLTRTRLLWATAAYFRASHLLVGLGMLMGAAVLTGALVVGDSIRGSLRDLTELRLGKIDCALTGARFVREALAADLAASEGFATQFEACAPAILLAATCERPRTSREPPRRVAGVQLVGLDERAWRLIDGGNVAAPASESVVTQTGVAWPVVLNARLAGHLAVQVGDDVRFTVELPSSIPRETLLGRRDATSVEIPARVAALLPDVRGAAHFGLSPDQQLPSNAFLSLRGLQEQLGLAARAPTRRDPRGRLARVNTLLASVRRTERTGSEQAADAGDNLRRWLNGAVHLADVDLRIVPDIELGYVSLESQRMLLEPAVVAAAEKVARDWPGASSPVFVYLANELDAGKGNGHYSTYSIVAGLDPGLFTGEARPPFGPFQLKVGQPNPLGSAPTPEDLPPIVLNDWCAQDLHAQPGDSIALRYHTVGPHGELPDLTSTFRLAGIVAVDSGPAHDRGLTPQVPGITDARSFDEWEQPFEMKMDRITRRDEQYWERYRATPKAFVALETARQLWGSRYGPLTSYRFAARDPGQDLQTVAAELIAALRRELPPEALGLQFRPVRQIGLSAARGSNDFGGLFLGFSFFLILSALFLIHLLFRLGIERRASQVGLLMATGWTAAQVRRLLLAEGGLLALAAAALGSLCGVAYAQLIVLALRTWWVGAVGTRFLEVHVQWSTVAWGAVLAASMGFVAMAWALRGLGRIPVRQLLAGITTLEREATTQPGRWSLIWGVGSLGVTLAITLAGVARWIPASQAFAGLSWTTIAFFVAGLSALTAVISLFAAWLQRPSMSRSFGRGWNGLMRLGVRNAVRAPSRSVLSTGLIASATFLIVAIACGHRSPAREAPDRHSGNGGFMLLGESSVPVIHDLNTPDGRKQLGFDKSSTGAPWSAVRQVIGFPRLTGDDASCLNLYQASSPTLLGVPDSLIRRGGFRFADTPGANPWELLRDREADGTIPALGDLNTLQYSLHKGIGDKLAVVDEAGRTVWLRIVGQLDGSVFQGMLLLSEDAFLQLHPSQAGSRWFLIDVEPEAAPRVAELLEANLPGFATERVNDRIARFLAVQNTYLSTFQTLGGLGLLLGTCGLAAVMLRNVYERRAETALLRACGLSAGRIGILILTENALLLVWGTAGGTAAALLAMAPHLSTTGADVQWAGVAGLLLAVIATGLVAAGGAVRAALALPVVATLRAE